MCLAFFSRGCNHYKSIHFAGAKIHFFFQIQFFLAKYSNSHRHRTSFPFKSIKESSPHQQSTPSVQRKDYFQNSRVQPPAGNITMSRKNIAITNTPIVIATLKNLYNRPGLPSFFRLSNSIVMTLIPFFESIQKAAPKGGVLPVIRLFLCFFLIPSPSFRPVLLLLT